MAAMNSLRRSGMWFTLVFITFIKSEEFLCPLNSLDCSQKDVACTIIRDPDCRMGNDVQSRSMNHKTYPGPVTNFSVKPYNLPPLPLSYSRARVEIGWSLPDDETFQSLTGFEVRISKSHGYPYCIIFNLTGEKPSWKQKYHYNFILNCTEFRTSGYSITVTSLPVAPFSDMAPSALLNIVQREMDTNPDECNHPQATECWDTHSVVYNDICNRVIRVSFTQPPDEMEFSGFLVALMNEDRGESQKTVTAHKMNGSSFLEARINTSSLALPLYNKAIEIIPQLKEYCFSCILDSGSKLFNITEGTKRKCSFTQEIRTLEVSQHSTSSSTGIVASIVVVAISIAGIITAIITVFARRKQERQSTNFPLDDDCEIPKYKVLLVYSYDSPQHQNVIGYFATLLAKNGCHVLFDQYLVDQIRDNKSKWIKNALYTSDFIVVVNSEGTFKKSCAVGKGMQYLNYDTRASCLGDMFTAVFCLIQSDFAEPSSKLLQKIVMVHFQYTPKEYRTLPLTPLQDKPNFELLRSISEMMTEMNLTIQNRQMHSLSVVSALARAIELAAHYKRHKRDWFMELNGPPITVDHMLMPTEYDTGIFVDESESFPLVSINDR